MRSQTGGLQILGGAHKCARPAAHRGAQRAEVAARLRRQKDQRLLRFGGNGDKHALLRTSRFQVSTRVNHSGGGGLVAPRRNATIRT